MFEATESPIQFSLVIPTFNERDNLVLLVQRVHKALSDYLYELIIVDDDSPDETWRLAGEIARDNPHLKVIRRLGERGLATAVVSGWKEARGKILGVMDGDLQYPPEFLPELLKAVDKMSVDLVVASRYVPGAKLDQWSLLRKMNSWGARLLARLTLPAVLGDIRDPGAGCFVMQRRVIDNIDLRPIGYKILLEVLARGYHSTVLEIPHHYHGRTEGKSKLDLRQHMAFLSHLTKLTWETGEFRRLLRRCTVGLSGVFISLAMIWVLTEVFRLFYMLSGAVAVECAILNNFFWHEVWTFADRTPGKNTLLHRLKRLLKFNTICGVGALFFLALLWALTEGVGNHYLIGATVGIAVTAVSNYNLRANSTWIGLQNNRQTTK